MEETDEAVDFYNITIKALRLPTLDVIASLLNPQKFIPTDDKLPRDWRGLADLAGINGQYLPALAEERNKTSRILELWRQNTTTEYTVKKLLEILEKIDRFDVIDDVKSLIDEDIHIYNRRESAEQAADAEDDDDDILTTDDVENLSYGRPLERYNAFVLFDKGDTQFTTVLIDTLEKERGLKLCSVERNLLGGLMKTDAITRLITERCDRLIVVVSPNFLNSAANSFFVKYAQAAGIEQKKRKVIPCLYEACAIPQNLSCYHLLDYKRLNDLQIDFWEKLYKSIVPSAPRAVKPYSFVPPINYRDVLGIGETLNNNDLEVPRRDVKFRVKVQSNGVALPIPIPSSSSESLSGEEGKKKKVWRWKSKIFPRNLFKAMRKKNKKTS